MKPFDYSELIRLLGTSQLASWIPDVQRLIETNLEHSNNGHLEAWRAALDALPAVRQRGCELRNAVTFTGKREPRELKETLLKLHPWRKGPITLADLKIDTEWRSDWKWDRLAPYIAPLEGKAVLDIGCGNGYHLWRMVGAGARLAVGIDPFLLFVMQFWAMKHFAPAGLPAWVLPMGWEDLPDSLPFFDTVFSMGVLYHRREPDAFLDQLGSYMHEGGELVLETLVLPGDTHDVLVPDGRYAKMRNVWYIPTVPFLISAIERVGWRNVRCIDVSPTSTEEQRSTDWMQFESLSDYLDPNDSSKTIEGYPAPCRAVVLATKGES